jgi:hypothetical protein
MTLLGLLLTLIVLGLIWWLIVTYIPFPPPGKVIVNVIFVVILIIILLNLIGVDMHFPLRVAK